MRCPSDAQAALLALVQDHLPAAVEWIERDESLHPQMLGCDLNPYPSKARLVVEHIDRSTDRGRFASADDYRWKHRNATVAACRRHGWLDGLHTRTIDWPPTTWERAHRWHMRQLDLTEDGMIALGVWRERRLKAPPAELPRMTDHEREVAELAQRALELGYALCARKPARDEARRLRRTGWFDAHGCWVANSATGLVPTPMALVEIRPDQADTVAMTDQEAPVRDDARMPPALRCPGCREWVPVEEMQGDPPAPKVPFAYTCPRCGHQADVREYDYSISPRPGG